MLFNALFNNDVGLPGYWCVPFIYLSVFGKGYWMNKGHRAEEREKFVF